MLDELYMNRSVMFLLIMFLVAQGLVEVVTSSDGQISVRATILLGELLHMVLQYLRPSITFVHSINISYRAINFCYVIFNFVFFSYGSSVVVITKTKMKKNLIVFGN